MLTRLGESALCVGVFSLNVTVGELLLEHADWLERLARGVDGDRDGDADGDATGLCAFLRGGDEREFLFADGESLEILTFSKPWIMFSITWLVWPMFSLLSSVDPYIANQILVVTDREFDITPRVFSSSSSISNCTRSSRLPTALMPRSVASFLSAVIR